MFLPSLVVAALLLLVTAVQIAFSFYFRRLMRVPSRENKKTQLVFRPDSQPFVTVLLPVRGLDPTLTESLILLLDQEYADYEIRVVVDSRTDPAWDPIEKIRSTHEHGSRLNIHEMIPPASPAEFRRSLKCHSLIQAVGHADERTEVIVLIDADVTPHRHWLADVVAPLADPQTGVVTGNQWFEPAADNAGSLLRSMWNAGAIVPTVMFRNPWAGTCAMRLSDARKSGLIAAWGESIIDDGPVRDAVNKLKLGIHFEPTLMMVNRDSCSARYVHGYITRMLTWSRIYESTFRNTLIHAVVSLILLTASALTIAGSLIARDLYSIVVSIVGLYLFCLGTTIGYLLVRGAVSRATAIRNNPLPSVSARRIVMLTLLAPVIQTLYAVSCIRAVFRKQVRWRQIEYRISGRTVEMQEYHPFEPEPDRSEGASI